MSTLEEEDNRGVGGTAEAEFSKQSLSGGHHLKDVEVYGFVGWIGTFVAYALFLMWAFVPEHVLHQLGITYYPDKHWALTVPAFLSVSFVLVGLAYVALNHLATAPLHSLHTLTDPFARGVAEDDPTGRRRHQQHPHPHHRQASSPHTIMGGGGGVPNIADLNIGVVNHLLYHHHHPQANRSKRSSRGAPRPTEAAAQGYSSVPAQVQG